MARTRLPDDYLDHIRAESRRFRDVLADVRPRGAGARRAPTGTPPTCSGTSREVQWFWATIDRAPGPAAPDEDDAGPERPDVVRRAAGAPSTSTPPAWSPSSRRPTPPSRPGPGRTSRPSGFTFRRQAHEALIHRLDAEQTAGEVTAARRRRWPPTACCECLDIMYGGARRGATFTALARYVRVDCTDTGDRVWVQLGRFVGTDPEDGKYLRRRTTSTSCADPGTDAGRRRQPGPPAALDAWLWRRGDDADVTRHRRPAASRPLPRGGQPPDQLKPP